MSNQFTIIHTPQGRKLKITGSLPPGFHGDPDGDGFLCPLDARNAEAIRKELPWSAPVQVGLRKSIGCGDRLGIATPGHLRAIRDGDMFPVLAQQSIREMTRARRSPQQVIDDATWGVVQANYQDGWACDADHLKTTEDIDACAAAGYMGYTLDPGQYVDDEANKAGEGILVDKVNALPWNDLRDNPQQHRAYHVDQLGWPLLDYLRSAAKYGGVIARVAVLNAHIQKAMGGKPYDLEVSVDETNAVTTPADHRFIALDLKRLEIQFIGLAPRFVGDFEKGVDYIGDLKAFELDYAEHAALARELGPYKMSIHSGSDKFSIYPIIARESSTIIHLKTAGTSWVEALRVIAAKDTALFREILELAVRGYEENRASYHVSGRADRIPQKSNAELSDLLDQFDAREVLHVSFGPVLAAFYDRIYSTLNSNIEAYWNTLRGHFDRHIQPFKGHA
jgi:tagaturonate epimerase